MALSSLWNKKIVQSKKSDDNAISFLKKYGSVQTSLIFSRQFLISYLAFYPFELITLLFKYMAYPVMTIDSDLIILVYIEQCFWNLLLLTPSIQPCILIVKTLYYYYYICNILKYFQKVEMNPSKLYNFEKVLKRFYNKNTWLYRGR